MASRIAGIEIGRYSVKVVIVASSLRSFEVVEAHEERVEPSGEPQGEVAQSDASRVLPDEVLAALGRLRQRGALNADAMIVGVQRDAGYLVQLELPFNTPREVEAVLLPQLDGRLPEEHEDLFADFMVGPKNARGEYLIHVIATRESVVAGLLAGLGSVDIDPRVIDVSPFELLAAVRYLMPGTDVPTAIVDIGHESTGVIIASGADVQAARIVPIGGESITRALAASFSLDLERAREGKHREAFVDAGEAASNTDAGAIATAVRDSVKNLVRQLRNTLHAHVSSGYAPVERIVLAGGTAAIAGLPEYIAQSLGVPTVRIASENPAIRLAGFDQSVNRYAGALGLALRGVSFPTTSRFNLRRGRYAFRGNYEFLRPRFAALGVGFGVIAASLVFFVASRLVLLKAEKAQLESTLSQLTEEVLGEAITSPSLINQRLLLAGSGPQLHPDVSAFALFVDIANAVDDLQTAGQNIKASALDVDFGRFLVRIEGEAESAESVDMLQAGLATVQCLHDVERTDLSTRGAGELFRFSLQAAISCERSEGDAAAGEAGATDAPATTDDGDES